MALMWGVLPIVSLLGLVRVSLGDSGMLGELLLDLGPLHVLMSTG